jgi:hypothetical protein
LSKSTPETPAKVAPELSARIGLDSGQARLADDQRELALAFVRALPAPGEKTEFLLAPRRVYVNFSPAVSRDALKAMRQTIRGWRVQLKNDKSLADLSAMLGPILRGWQQYYGHFHGSALKSVWRRVNRSLIGWLMRKHKKLAGHKTRAAETLKMLATSQPRAFVHWSMGYLS